MVARLVPAVSRAADILELFLSDDGELSVPDMSEALSLPRTTVHELVATMVSRLYLAPSAVSPNRYRLGMKVFELGGAYSARLDLAREGAIVAGELAEVSGETAQIAILDGSDVLYLVKVDSPQAIRLVSSVGRRLPAHCTAVGKVLLAFLAEADFARIYPRDEDPLLQMTERTIVSRAQLLSELRKVRAEGLAREQQESNENAVCVAAPVRDASGQVVAAVSVSVPVYRRASAWSNETTALVKRASVQLSARLGGMASMP